MATDDERREVAERLRRAAEQGQPYTVPTLACFIGADCDGIWTRLADLIDPDCDEGRYEGVHTARPVDREALLALADEMDKWALTCDHYDRQVSPLDVTRHARRIREALGVVA